MGKRLTAISTTVLLSASLIAAAGPAASAADPVSGTITILTHRTDRVADGTFDKYKAAFNAIYPDVTVNFEGITDYEGEVRTRMSTDQYGDVLVIPNSVAPGQLPTFFEPLGTVADLGQQYRFITEQAYDGMVYGIATTGNAQGLVYNKKVWAAAGVTAWPTSPEEFLADLQLIKDKTDSIPLYTNYAAGWPTTQWEGNRGSISNNPSFKNDLAHTDAPWAEGTDHYVIDKLMYDVVHAGLVEEDPTTTDWELSKGMLGDGTIATMVLGSWSIVQMQAAAADPADIGYMPFPHQIDGVFYSAAGGDYKIAINVHSQNKAAARAWLDWYVNDSGFAAAEGGIPPLIAGAFPSQLADFATNGVKFTETAPPIAGEESLTDDIDKEAEIGLFDVIFPQRIIDAARGATDETLDAIFTDLNTRWAAAKTKLGG